MSHYVDLLSRVNKLMREEFPESGRWALIVDDGGVWDVAGFDIDSVIYEWVANREKEKNQ